MFSLKTQFCTGLHHIRQGKNSGIKAFLIIFHPCKTCQFLAACCEQDIPLCLIQILGCRLNALHINSLILTTAGFTQHPSVKCLCFLTGCTDIYCYFRCIRMSRIQYHLRLLLNENLLHGCFVQPSGLYSEIFIFSKRLTAIFCSCKSHCTYLMICQEPADFIPLCGSCKNKNFIHSYILSVLPSCGSVLLSENFQ